MSMTKTLSIIPAEDQSSFLPSFPGPGGAEEEEKGGK
jgi:hypothetical protein